MLTDYRLWLMLDVLPVHQVDHVDCCQHVTGSKLHDHLIGCLMTDRGVGTHSAFNVSSFTR